jgi:peptide/nickel transport system permease protein
MQRYILRRFFQALITLLAVSIIVFFLARLTGNPLHLLMPLDATEEDYRQAAKELGLDKPLPVQYGIFLVKAVKGDFGKSIRVGRPVSELLKIRVPNSLKLALAAIIVTALMAVPLGIIAAVKKGSFWDGLAQVIAVLGQSLPIFWVGIVFIFIFSVRLNLLPTSGMGGISHYILPAFTLGWALVAAIARLLRSSMLEVLDSEYIKMARIKGTPEGLVIWKHALKNALIPVVTFGGFYFAILLTGAVITETVFAWPGMGRLAYEAIMWRDFPVIQGVVLLATALVVTVNLLVDILYAYIDPRIRHLY